MSPEVLKTARHLLKQAKSLKDVNNWLYLHTKLLGRYGIVTGDRAASELKRVAKSQIDASHYVGAMATLRKLHDLHSNEFYDYNSYERVPFPEIKTRILNHK